jgi:hypothetical protein
MSPISVESLSRSASKLFTYIVIISIVILGYKISLVAFDKFTGRQMARREAICPSLLSISRSARDTLIVMKAENLCNSFVLDNLK